MKKAFLFYTRQFSACTVLLFIFILSTIFLQCSAHAEEEIIKKVQIIMTEPNTEKGKSLPEFIEEIIILINQNPEAIQRWLAKHNLTLHEFLQALNEAKNAKNIFAVQKAFNKFWPAVPEYIKRVGLFKIAINVGARLRK